MRENIYQRILDNAKIAGSTVDEAVQRAEGTKDRTPPPGQRCEWPKCRNDGEHRAPLSRDDLDRFRWFCVDHVRVYNKAWNFYADMTEDEVEQSVRRDTTWNRPSWPLSGKRLLHATDGIEDWMRDFGLDGDEAAKRARPENNDDLARAPEDPVVDSLAVLGLRPPVDSAEVKSRYKELVKRYHPDTNGGDKEAEERFKDVGNAYRTIMEFLDI